MSTFVKTFAVVGSIIHSLRFGELQVLTKGAIVYNATGVIERIVDLSDFQGEIRSNEGPFQGIDEVKDYTGKMIMPGFVDAHLHAPQYVFTGTGMDLPLLEWLEKYTFPCESRFSDLEFARMAYTKVVRRLLRGGTTFASYFGTIHNSAAKILADVITSVGQRAFVGKVSMDRNAPPFYIEETTTGCDDAEDFVRHVLSMSEQGRAFLARIDAIASQVNNDQPQTRPFPSFSSPDTLLNKCDTPLVLPCVTPRFVPTCTPVMMERLAAISRKYGVPMQSHLSESRGEIEWVSALHPDCETYAQVYNKFGILHDACYMAHCCHSDLEERTLLKNTGTGIVHCPSSNFMLESGVMDARNYVNEGLKVALGTDVAGGYSPSMLDAIRQTVIASKVKAIHSKGAKNNNGDNNNADQDYKSLSYKEVFHLATVGGAEVLGMGDVIGNFQAGKKLDCIVADVQDSNGPLDLFGTEDLLEKFQKFLFLGDDRNIVSVYVDGKQVI